jgi:ribonuclease HII
MSPGAAARAGTRVSAKWEIRLGHPARLVAGCDEVGRGCLAGPVVAGAVILPAEPLRAPFAREINDSKKLTATRREHLEPLIKEWALSWALGVASVAEIDRLNIYHASHLALIRAVEALHLRPEAAIVDGNVVPRGFPCRGTAVIGGDALCLSVAAASILAKVARDRHMAEVELAHPGYGFRDHKGYATPEHSAALRKLGPTPVHRRSFAPVAESGPEGPVQGMLL